MIPLTDELHREIGEAGESKRFVKLSIAVGEWARAMSLTAPVAYIEAEFFGGVGGQSAMVWSRGSEIREPVHAQDAINRALRLLGVRAGDAYDEFAALGLGRRRDTHDWLA